MFSKLAGILIHLFFKIKEDYISNFLSDLFVCNCLKYVNYGKIM